MFRIALCIALVACGNAKQPAAPPVTPVAPAAPVEPAKPEPPKLPQLDAQAKFLLWLTAFNDSDQAGLTSFTSKHVAAELAKDFPPAPALLGFREQTGGFDVKKTEEVTPQRYVALVKERDADQFARVIVE